MGVVVRIVLGHCLASSKFWVCLDPLSEEPVVCIPDSGVFFVMSLVSVISAHPASNSFFPGRNFSPPPPHPISGHKAFFREGGGSVYFEAPRGRNFIRPPPPPPFIHPPPLEGSFQGWGGGACIKFGPVVFAAVLVVFIVFVVSVMSIIFHERPPACKP